MTSTRAMQPRRPPISISLTFDFDGTLTTADTTGVLGQLGLDLQARRRSIGPVATFDNDETGTKTSPTRGFRQSDSTTRASDHHLRPTAPSLPQWNHFLDAYSNDLEAHNAFYPPKSAPEVPMSILNDPRLPSPKKPAVAAAIAYQNSLRPVEEASAKRVCDGGVFDDITAAEIEDGAAHAFAKGDVVIRPGWRELLALMDTRQRTAGGEEEADSKTHASFKLDVLSVNWSRTWVVGCLRAAAPAAAAATSAHSTEEHEKQSVDPVRAWAVTANEIPSIAHPITTPSTSRLATNEDSSLVTPPSTRPAHSIRVSADKLAYFRHGHADNRYMRVYIGDSPTDIECLLDAHVGICIRDADVGSGQRELKRTLEEVGRLDVAWVGDDHGQWAEDSKRRLLWASDLGEVVSWVGRAEEAAGHE